MPKFNTVDDLQSALLSLGFNEARALSMAKEQHERGIPHVETASFLAIVRSFLTSHTELKKIDFARNASEDVLKYNAIARGRNELLQKGVDPVDILRFERTVQMELLVDMFALLDNVSDYKGIPVDEFNLYAINEQTNDPEVLLDGLHECIPDLQEH